MAETDGAIPGQVMVAVTATDADLSQVQAAPGKGRPTPKALAQVNKAAKSLIPKKSASSQTSPLAAEVKAQANSSPFDLAD